jgi:hypothetical protein
VEVAFKVAFVFFLYDPLGVIRFEVHGPRGALGEHRNFVCELRGIFVQPCILKPDDAPEQQSPYPEFNFN